MYEIKGDKMMPKKFLFKYFKDYKNGDNKAREILILDGIKLVISIIEKDFTNPNFEQEEFLSAGIIGLIKSVDTYKMAREKSFEDYATRHIKNEIYKYMREERKNFYKTSLDFLLEIKQIEDINQDVVSMYEEQEEVLIIRKLMTEELTNRVEKDIIKLYFGLNNLQVLTLEKIANKLGVSYEYVELVINRFIVKMSSRIKEEYRVKVKKM